MDGSSLSRAMGNGLIAMGCFLFVAGGAVAIGLFFLIRWILAHLSISWN